MTEHRAWRLNYLSTPRGYCSTATLEMRGVAGGPDLTQGATGAAIADSAYSSSYSAAMAFDNNGATFWSSANQSGIRYLGWDFGAGNAVAIVQIAYMGRNDSYCDQDSPRPGNFEFSDDMVTWTAAHDIVAPTTYNAGTTYLFDVAPVPAPPQAVSKLAAYVVEGPPPIPQAVSKLAQYVVEGAVATQYVSKLAAYIVEGPPGVIPPPPASAHYGQMMVG